MPSQIPFFLLPLTVQYPIHCIFSYGKKHRKHVVAFQQFCFLKQCAMLQAHFGKIKTKDCTVHSIPGSQNYYVFYHLIVHEYGRVAQYGFIFFTSGFYERLIIHNGAQSNQIQQHTNSSLKPSSWKAASKPKVIKCIGPELHRLQTECFISWVDQVRKYPTS